MFPMNQQAEDLLMGAPSEVTPKQLKEGADGASLPMIERMQGRMGHPSDVTGTIAFLASDEAALTTGTTFVIDGGTSACLS